MSELLSRHRAVIPNWVGIYYDEPIEIVSGKGCRVTDAQGRGYLDFFAGILTNMLGYDVPEVREAVERQLRRERVRIAELGAPAGKHLHDLERGRQERQLFAAPLVRIPKRDDASHRLGGRCVICGLHEYLPAIGATMHSGRRS